MTPQRIPKTKNNNINPPQKKPKQGVNIEPYNEMPICWQIGSIDLDSKWGLQTILGNVKFVFSNSLYEKVFEFNDEELNKILESFKNRTFSNTYEFIKKLQEYYQKPIPPKIFQEFLQELSKDYFLQILYPLLKDRENSTWQAIERATHGRQGKSNSHHVSVGNLCPDAQKRLKEMKLDDIDEIYSLRLGGELRIYGIRKYNYLKILWVDPNHEIYPV
ncbi:hypothetical protein [Gabonibacter massiliensis]|uniref:hypothetical protein n=1 Tax=Gabonibacter massiliensis TaxID=1720195 RepID=UPI00073F9865|nr:hypothetical protein [Gabonibacter massiliensis]